MERVESGDEAGHSLESSDLVVDTFERPIGDWVIVRVEDSRAVAFQSLFHGVENVDFGRASSATPAGQESPGEGFARRGPDQTEIFFPVVSDFERTIQVDRLLQTNAFVFRFIQMARMFHQQPAYAFQKLAVHQCTFTLQVATLLSQLVNHQLHDVKSIEHMQSIRHVFDHGRVVSTRHFIVHSFDPGFAASH